MRIIRILKMISQVNGALMFSVKEPRLAAVTGVLDATEPLTRVDIAGPTQARARPASAPDLQALLGRGPRVDAPRRTRFGVGAIVTIALHVGLVGLLFVSTRVLEIIKPPAPVVVVNVSAPQEIKPVEAFPKILPPTLNIPKPILVPPTVAIAEPPPTAPTAVTITQPPAPPSPPASQNTAAVVETYQAKVLRHLNRYKRFPVAAKQKRQQGVAYIFFAMDRTGRVLAAYIQKSAGFAVLDDEALALIRRAEPLPVPPQEVVGNPLEMIVPVDFFVR